jgi:hypothetical protein
MNPNENSSASCQRQIDRAPENRQVSREDLLVRARKLFGNEVEYTRLTDVRFPKILKNTFSNLGIWTTGEIISVPCGGLDNLCAIVLPAHNSKLISIITSFLAQNPCLDATVITQWQNLVIIWMRNADWHPTNRTLPGALWVSRGIVPLVTLTDSRASYDGFPLRGNSIVTTKFGNLTWSQMVYEIFLLELLEGVFGKLFLVGQRNHKFFGVLASAWFFALTFKLKYNRVTNSFLMCWEEGKSSPIQESLLENIIGRWLYDQAELNGVTYPRRDPAGDIIKALKQIPEIQITSEI